MKLLKYIRSLKLTKGNICRINNIRSVKYIKPKQNNKTPENIRFLGERTQQRMRITI